jgi:hypothetical protein
MEGNGFRYIRAALLLILLALAISGSASSAAASLDLIWQKCLGGSAWDYAESIQQTTDGGYIVAGRTASNNGNVSGNHGNWDCWVVKLNVAGKIEWQKCLGGSSADYAYSAQETADGGYIVAGSTESSLTGDVGSNHGGFDYWVVKLDGLGNIVWQKCLGGSSFEQAYSVQQTADGGYVVAGYTYSSLTGDVGSNHGVSDFWVVKLDGLGNIVWQKCLGGSSFDEAHSIQQTADGGYIAAGYTWSNNGNVSGNHGVAYDYWVVKLDGLGNIVWQKCLGGNSYDWAESIQQTTDGGFIVAGRTYSSLTGDVGSNHGDWDYWIVKLDGLGNIIWQKCLGGSSTDYAYSVQQTADGGYIVAGYTSSNDGNVTNGGYHGANDYWVVKLDGLGNIVWQKCLGGSSTDYAYSIQQTADSGYIVAGSTNSNDGNVSGKHALDDFWVLKLSETRAGISISKIAMNDTHSSIREVPAGSKFYYNISVINSDPAHHALDVAVADKLPYDVVYDSAKAQASNGAVLTNVTIHKTGDLLYVDFERIPKGKTFYINITAYAPSEAPTTLYNTVNVRSANDPNPEDNTVTLATYVPSQGYGKPAAVKSFEELLHNQTRLLFDFEDLLHVVPKHQEENYTFIASFEQLLRAQANLSLSFEDLLENENKSGWDLGNFTEEQKVDFLKSFKGIIWDEAFLFSSFEMKLKDAWVSLDGYTAPGHSQDAQTEFIASFENLLKEQTKLFSSYQLLLKNIGTVDSDDKVDALAAFENLLRVEANLLMSFEDLLKRKWKKI